MTNNLNNGYKTMIYYNYKKVSCYTIREIQTILSLNNLINKADTIEEKILSISADKNDRQMIQLLEENDFKARYDWFIYEVNNSNYQISDYIIEIPNRKEIEELLIHQLHECSERMPQLFNEKGEDDDWVDLGEVALGYIINNKVVSILTFSIKEDNSIHIYLTYTKPEYRSQGLSTKMFDFIKNYASQNRIKIITVCTDVSEGNRVPNMFYKNGFKYFKTSYTKFLKEG